MAIKTIPVFTDPTFTERVELDGSEYVLRFFHNEREGYWYLSIHDVDDVAIMSSIKLVIGFPLLRKNATARRPPGELFLLDMTGTDTPPAREELGTRCRLVYLDAAELGR